jgi:hypothetical protein
VSFTSNIILFYLKSKLIFREDRPEGLWMDRSAIYRQGTRHPTPRNDCMHPSQSSQRTPIVLLLSLSLVKIGERNLWRVKQFVNVSPSSKFPVLKYAHMSLIYGKGRCLRSIHYYRAHFLPTRLSAIKTLIIFKDSVASFRSNCD